MAKTIYLIPGVGANDKVFQNLDLGGYEIVHIKWPKHRKNETLQAYVKKLQSQIKKDTEPILIGLSFGGIVAIELAKLIDPYKTIIISSIKTYHERPLKFMFMNSVKFHRLLPVKLVMQFRFWIKWLVGNLSKKDMQLVELMIQETNIEFNKWAVDQVIQWQNEELIDNLTHIHGTQDRIFPDFYIKDAIRVRGGSHFMVANRAKEISKIIRKELSSDYRFKPTQKKQLKRA